jgi:hypothetical protein
LLSFDFALSNFENLLLGLLYEPLFVIASLLLLSSLCSTDLGFFLACSAALSCFDSTLASDFLLLSLELAVLTL